MLNWVVRKASYDEENFWCKKRETYVAVCLVFEEGNRKIG